MKWPWGGDRTWTNGAWRDSEATAARAGAGVLLAEPIREPKGNQSIWAVLGVVITLLLALSTLPALFGARPLEAGVQLAGLLVILALPLRRVVKVHTRRVQFDEAGLSDVDFFGVRRVPWDAVKSMKPINLNAKSQRDYDRTRLTERIGPRPEDNMGAWDVCGEQGVVLLRLHKNMIPQDALSALRGRIQQQIRDGSRDVDGEGRRVLDPDDPGDRKLIEEHEAIARRMDQVRAEFGKRGDFVERVMKGFMALTFLLPLAGTCYLGYQSLWFKFAAAEAQGQVVSIHPAVVVEYRETRRIVRSSDAAHDEELVVGANVRVLYDPADPDRVRLDLFDEMWANTLLLGGLTLFVGLLAGPVWWGMRQAKAGSKARRAARAS